MFLFTFTNNQPASRIAVVSAVGGAKEQGANAAGAPPGAMNR
jgi:hypothetical protein